MSVGDWKTYYQVPPLHLDISGQPLCARNRLRGEHSVWGLHMARVVSVTQPGINFQHNLTCPTLKSV